jgi:ribosome maturation factor RimP
MKLRISLLLVVAMPIYSQFMLAQTPGEKSPEQVKVEVLKRGTGKKAKVRVKVRQGSEVRGYVSKVDQDSFDVTEKTGKTVTIAYGDVVKVQKPGMSKGAKIGIAAGAIAFVIAAGVASAIASLGP